MSEVNGSKMATRVFRAVWQHPHISRVEIARSLGIEKSTVTTEVSRLMEKGLIEEVREGVASSSGGRRPIHLSISRSAGHLVGIDLRPDSYRALAVDLMGNVLVEYSAVVSFAGKSLAKTLLSSRSAPRSVSVTRPFWESGWAWAA